MGGTGLEHEPLTLVSASKIAISQTQRAKCGALDGEIDPDLAAIIRSWPDLTADVKKQIKELIGRSGQ